MFTLHPHSLSSSPPFPLLPSLSSSFPLLLISLFSSLPSSPPFPLLLPSLSSSLPSPPPFPLLLPSLFSSLSSPPPSPPPFPLLLLSLSSLPSPLPFPLLLSQQATILRELMQGFVFESNRGTRVNITAECPLGPQFSFGWNDKKGKKFKSKGELTQQKVACRTTNRFGPTAVDLPHPPSPLSPLPLFPSSPSPPSLSPPSLSSPSPSPLSSSAR